MSATYDRPSALDEIITAAANAALALNNPGTREYLLAGLSLADVMALSRLVGSLGHTIAARHLAEGTLYSDPETCAVLDLDGATVEVTYYSDEERAAQRGEGYYRREYHGTTIDRVEADLGLVCVGTVWVTC